MTLTSPSAPVSPAWLQAPGIDRPPKAGVTLVELLVAATVLMLVGMVGLRLVRSFSFSQAKVVDRLSINLDAIRASDRLATVVRNAIEVVRPELGETTPFLVLRNAENELVLVYLKPDQPGSVVPGKPTYQVVAATRHAMGARTEETVLFGAVRRLTFTSTTPNQVSFRLTVGNAKSEFELLSQVALMNAGGLE